MSQLFKFRIEDELHAEPHGEYKTYEEAIAALRLLSKIAWKDEPNFPPCGSKICGRRYEIIAYKKENITLKEVTRTPVLEVLRQKTTWLLKDKIIKR